MRRTLLAVALSFCSASAFAAMKSEPIEYKVGNDSFSGYLVYDDAAKEKRPGLVMVPNWLGATQDSVEKAKKIAGDDYVILIADVYGKGLRPKNAKEAGEQTRKSYSDGGTTLRARAQAAVDTLKALRRIGGAGVGPLGQRIERRRGQFSRRHRDLSADGRQQDQHLDPGTERRRGQQRHRRPPRR